MEVNTYGGWKDGKDVGGQMVRSIRKSLQGNVPKHGKDGASSVRRRIKIQTIFNI